MNKGIVVAEQPDAVEVGARILMAGGNAVDPAIACAFGQGVVDQMNGGVAGYGCAQVYLPGRGLYEGSNFLFQAPAGIVPGMDPSRSFSRLPRELAIAYVNLGHIHFENEADQAILDYGKSIEARVIPQNLTACYQRAAIF
jgi:gamma-glutamyltranspeptidase